MTDKRAWLDGIRARCNTVDTYWLITELEAAWAEVERLNKVSEGWHQESERYRRCAEAAEAERDRLREALAQIANHPHNVYDHPENGGGQYGIGVTDGHRCAADIARAALEESARKEEERG